MRRRRVLISGVLLGQAMGGVRRHNQELLPRLAALGAAQGLELAVLAGRGGLAFELPREIEVLPSDVRPHPVLARAVFEPGALAGAIESARRAGRPFDLVHTAHLPTPRSLPVPYTLTLHDLRALDPGLSSLARRLIARRLLERALRGARAVLTVSQHVRGSLIQRFDLDPARVTAIYNGGEHFLPLAPDHPTRARSPELLHVGHVERRKNLELLLGALALDPTLPPLRLVGAEKRGEEQRLRHRARRLGVEQRVTFAGAALEAQLPRLYSRAACVVLPARLEGFGLAVLEAHRARAPLAVADSSALHEIAAPSAPRFGPDDPAGCASAIRRALLQSPAELEAQALHATRFTWDGAARAWLEVWSSLWR